MTSSGIKKGLLVPALAILIYSLVLLRLPLFNELGYEFSVAVALIVPILNWRLFRKYLKNARLSPREFTIASLRGISVHTQLQSLIVLCIPLLCSAVNLFFVKNCSFDEGMIFYLLIPIVTSLWVQGMVALCCAAFRKPLLWFIGCLIACIGYPLYLGYAHPQIYSYNFIYGFFGGFSYDETLTISSTLFVFRLLTLYCGIVLYWIAEFIIRKRSERGTVEGWRLASQLRVVLVICAPLMLAWVFRADLGFESPAEYIRQQLGSSYSTEHFRIYYSGKAIPADEIQYVAAMHEFRFSQVESALRTSFRGTIDSYIYPDADFKRAFIGTGNTNIAKPWRREIHLNIDAWESTLKHELVHVLAGEFGMPVIRAHYNIGLVEGLAMAVDPEFGNKSLHEYAAAMLKFGLIADPGRLVRPVGFATQSSSVSYVMMGSFIRFLIDRYGVPRFKELYGGKSVNRAYGITYDRLIDEWTRLLSSVDVPESWRKHVEYYFRRPSIFAKECAHAVANANEEGNRQLARNSPAAAIAAFSRGLTMSWNSESFTGLIRASYSAARYDTLISLMDTQLQDSVRRSSIISLYLLYGDALWYRNDAITAREVFAEIVKYDLSERLNEAAILRGVILRDQQLRMNLADYVVGSLDDSTAIRLFDRLESTTTHPVVCYLRAKLLMREKQYHGAILQLDSFHERFDSAILNARKEELLGESYFFLHDYQQARAHFWRSLNDITSASWVKRVEDWIERCDYFAKSWVIKN